MNIFGGGKSPAEMLRQHQRALQKAMRELDRERSKMESSEKKLIADIKKSAKAGQNNACKIQAQDLVRTRRYIQKFYQMRTQLQGVSLRIQTMKANQSMADAMKGVTKAMKQMNKRINLPAIQKIMQEFEQESEVMDMKEEMMNDAIDDAMDEEEDEEESDRIVQSVLDEIGITLNQALPNAGTEGSAVAAKESSSKVAAAPVAEGADADLQARLDSLRRDDWRK